MTDVKPTAGHESYLVVMCGEGVDCSFIVHGWDALHARLEEEGFTLDELSIDDPDAWTTCAQDDIRFERHVEFEIGWLRITRITDTEAGTVLHETGLTPRELAEQNRQLRVLLAGACAGINLYSDDGELQDNSTRPYIDFLRMSPTELGAAFYERAKAKIALARNETE